VMPMILRVAKAKGLPVIDLYCPFWDKPELLPDRIHPDAHGSALMAGIIARHLVARQEDIVDR